MTNEEFIKDCDRAIALIRKMRKEVSGSNTSTREDEKMINAIEYILNENYTDAAVIQGVEIAEIVNWLEEHRHAPISCGHENGMRAEVSGEKKDNYIDLGLPSGTLWADTNEEGFYTFDEAVEKFGKSLPGIAQLAELREFCEWNWDDEKEGYKVTGKNGNSIFLPAAGCRIDNCICESGEFGHLWSSTANSSISDSISFAHSLHFGDSGVNLSGFDDCLNGRSVRLVKPSCWETEQKELM